MSTDSRTVETVREKPLGQYRDYTISKISVLDGEQAPYPTFELLIRAHTSVIVADQDQDGGLEYLLIQFNAVNSVQHIGIELLRKPYVELPLDGIVALEQATGMPYQDTRKVNNPLNSSMAHYDMPVRYPSQPAPTTIEFDTDRDDDGGVKLTP